MIVFLAILSGLLIINVFLLLVSVNSVEHTKKNSSKEKYLLKKSQKSLHLQGDYKGLRKAS